MFSWGGRHGGFCPGQEAPRLLELLQENALVRGPAGLSLSEVEAHEDSVESC